MFISRKWLQMSEIYKKFSQCIPDMDFSRRSMEEMYLYESKGIKFMNSNNGYMQGKKWMDVTVQMWNTGFHEGLLCRYELEQEFPDWFLDRVLIIIGNQTSQLTLEDRLYLNLS